MKPDTATRWLLVASLVPAGIALAWGFMAAALDGWAVRDVINPLAGVLFWLPLGLHAPIIIGLVLRERGRDWLRWGPVGLWLYFGFMSLGGPLAWPITVPFLAAGVCAHLAGRRLGAAPALPALPDVEQA